MKYVKYSSKCYHDYENSDGVGFLGDDNLISFNQKNSIEYLFSFRGMINLKIELNTFLTAYVNNMLYELFTLEYDYFDCYNDQIVVEKNLYLNEPFKMLNNINVDYLNFVLKRILNKSSVMITITDDVVNFHVTRSDNLNKNFYISVNMKNKHLFEQRETKDFLEYFKIIKEITKNIIEA